MNSKHEGRALTEEIIINDGEGKNIIENVCCERYREALNRPMI